MGVEIDGLADMFEELDELEDDFSGPVESWVVGSNQEYGPFLEYGTSPHVIEGNPLAFPGEGGDTVFAQKVNHPGTDPRPHWRPAVNEVRLKGAGDFIEDNSNVRVETIEDARQLVATLAFSIERNLKGRVTDLGLIDTGAYRASIGAVPLSDIGDLE
jgi:hypothetical protein